MKYKKDSGDLIENVDVALVLHKKDNLYLITAALSTTQNGIYTGLLIKGRSSVKLMNKKE